MPPNEDQIAYWNGPSGQRWAAGQATMDAGVRQYGALALEAAAAQPGERVLDVGCGAGDTTLELARRVGPEGRVLGVDISAPMLARARHRAEGITNVSFIEADASTYQLPAKSFDLIFSRFGVMFFDEPKAAFTNLHAALAPGGRVAFVCWRTLEENAWARVPLEAAMSAAGATDPWPSGGPGPFSLGPAGEVESVLGAAGFSEVRATPRELEHRWGSPDASTLDDGAEAALTYGPGARVLATVDEAARPALRAAVREALAPYARPEGVYVPAAVFVVTARA